MSKNLIVRSLTVMLALAASAGASAQTQFIMADRNSDSLWRVRDLNGDGVIADPGEMFLWFSGANAAGTLAPMNTTTQAVSKCRIVIMGDQVNRNVYRLTDINDDGDAQDAGESIVFADATNASLVSFAFPTGAAFDSQCRAYIVNAGNTFGNDGIYRLVDLNSDGDAQDFAEITPYVTDGPSGFGPGNGPYSPQEIYFDANDVGYLRNSSANLQNIYRFVDANANGRADDAGEFTLFFGTGNASGITVSAGFALEPNRAYAGPGNSMYTLQIAAGGVDQLIRVVDLNNDGDGQDANEAAIVYSIATAFTGVDVVSLMSGDVLLTDNTGNTVVRLHDANGDGDFIDVGESTIYVPAPGTITQDRQMDILCRLGDVDCDGTVGINDLVQIITNWGQSGACNLKPDVDCNNIVDITDLVIVITRWG